MDNFVWWWDGVRHRYMYRWNEWVRIVRRRGWMCEGDRGVDRQPKWQNGENSCTDLPEGPTGVCNVCSQESEANRAGVLRREDWLRLDEGVCVREDGEKGHGGREEGAHDREAEGGKKGARGDACRLMTARKRSGRLGWGVDEWEQQLAVAEGASEGQSQPDETGGPPVAVACAQ